MYEIIVFILLLFALALILSLIWSGASHLSKYHTIFSAYRKLMKNASLYSSICQSPGTWWHGAFLIVVFSNLLVFSYFWCRPILYYALCVTMKLEQRGEKCKNTGSAVRSRTLCSDVFVFCNTDSVEDFP